MISDNPRLGSVRARQSDYSYQWCVAHGIELKRIGYFKTKNLSSEPAWEIPAWARFLCRTVSMTLIATRRLIQAIVADPELQDALTALIASDLTDTQIWAELKEIIL